MPQIWPTSPRHPLKAESPKSSCEWATHIYIPALPKPIRDHTNYRVSFRRYVPVSENLGSYGDHHPKIEIQLPNPKSDKQKSCIAASQAFS